MPITTTVTYTCEECGKVQQGHADHWLRLTEYDHRGHNGIHTLEIRYPIDACFCGLPCLADWANKRKY